ncbi:hypothetical protein Q5752_001212 [Cryptotrichosporon argae]
MAATMARPSLAIARLHPATVRHVLRLVTLYLPEAGPSRLPLPRSTLSQIRLASHAAMRIDDVEPPPPAPPLRASFPSGSSAPAIPYWAALPPPLHDALYDLTVPSAHAFRCAFISSSARPVTLAPVPVLALVLDLFRTTAAAEDWAWLADTLVDALRQTARSQQLPGSPALIRAVRAVALGKMGDWAEARKVAAFALRDTVKAVEMQHVGHTLVELVVSCLRLYILALRQHGRAADDVADVLRFAGNRAQRFVLGQSPPRDAAEHDLHAVLTASLVDIADPVAWVTARLTGEDGNDTPVHHVAAGILVALLASSHSRSNPRLSDALALFRLIGPRPAFAGPLSALGLSLAHAGRHDDAASVFAALRQTGPVPALLASRELKSLALAGRHADVVAAWDALDPSHEPGPRDRQIYLRSLAQVDPHAVPVVAARLLGDDHDVDSDHQAAALLFDAAINAGNPEVALQHLEALERLASRPLPLKRYTDVLFLFAAQANLDGAVRTFDGILAAGLEPTVSCFTSLIALFGDRHDAVNARLVFDAMVLRGLEPDAVAVAALIDAEVEAGEFEAAADRLDSLDEALLSHPSIVTAALKSFVYVSSPIKRVLPLFRTIDRPSAYAWALVIQSAADSEDLALARALFDEMDAAATSPAEPGASGPGVNAYTSSILLAAYLRIKDRAAAREVFDDMLRRGIVPSTVTYAMIVRSFAKTRGGGPGTPAFQRAHDLAMTVLDRVRRGARGKRRAPDRDVEDLVGPLLVAAGRAGDVDAASGYYDIPAQRTITFMAKMMDVYARAGRVGDVARVFDDCVVLALARFPRRTPDTPAPAVAAGLTRTHNNALCVPLSILIGALAAAGDRAAIKRAWDRVRTTGFGFDSENYNHLARALAQTGDVEGAFHVIDRVVLPRWDEVCARQDRGVRPGGHLPALGGAASPGVNGASAASGEPDDVAEHATFSTDQPAAYGAPPAHPPNRRPALVALAPFPRADLDVLREWRPADAMWRVAYRTLAALSDAYGHVEDAHAHMWMALGADEAEAEVEADADDAGAPARLGQGEIEVPDVQGRPRRTTPKALIMRLNRKYARVVALVMLHRRKEADRQRRL